jgi:cytochrome P450
VLSAGSRLLWGVANAVPVLNAGLDDSLTALFASSPQVRADPFPLWNRLREQAPVHTYRHEMVVVCRYHDVKRVLQDSSDRYRVDVGNTATADALAALSPEVREACWQFHDFVNLFIIRRWGPDHARLRRVTHRLLAATPLDKLRASIQRHADELLDPLVEQETSDMMKLAYPLPAMLIVELLGCPQEDRAQLLAWLAAIRPQLDRFEPATVQDAMQAIRNFREYVHELAAAHRRRPEGSSLIAAVVRDQDGDGLSDEELVALFVLLLFGGHETTTNLVSLGLLELLRHPEQWRLLCREPSLLDNAIDELLRWVTPVHWTSRMVARDHEVAGVPVSEGQWLGLSLAAANRDPRAFADPDTLDITRPDASLNLAFGFGPKFCLGAAMARLEARVVFSTLFTRFPGMQLAAEALTFTGSVFLRRPTHLPVRLRPER